MKLIHVEDVSLGHADKVFRNSPVAGLFAAVCFVAVAGAFALAGFGGVVPALPAAFACGTLLVFALIAGFTARRSFSPQNWLMASDGHRLLIKLRSYLNPGFPADLPYVLELDPDDVTGFRATVSTLTGHDAAGEAAQGNTVFLDIVLKPAIDVADLEDRLSVERQYRDRGAVWRHYPVTIVKDRTIRLEWRARHSRIQPRIEEAIRVLATFAPPLPSQSEHVDLGRAGGQPVNAQPEQEVRALAEQGRVVEATLLAVRSFGISTTEARQYVERISIGRVLPAPGPDPDATSSKDRGA